MVSDLGKYVEFFKRIIVSTFESCIKQNIFIVEFRHRSGILFDEGLNPIPVEEEMKIIMDVVEKFKATAKYKCPITGNMLPHPFEFILIISGLKVTKAAGT